LTGLAHSQSPKKLLEYGSARMSRALNNGELARAARLFGLRRFR